MHPHDDECDPLAILASQALEQSLKAGKSIPPSNPNAAQMFWEMWEPHQLLAGMCKDGMSPAAADGWLPEIENYKIEKQIGQGGQGVVFEGWQSSTGRHVAIKVLSPFARPMEQRRFDQEIHVLANLRHPNIVTIYDSARTKNGFYYYVMDYVDGQPLDDYVASHKCSVDQILNIFVQVCDAVDFANLNDTSHRDLKPANILVDEEGKCHVLDFGLAKVKGNRAAPISIVGEFLGTLRWASPEQVNEALRATVDNRTDVYSLGVMLYQALTRQFPYDVNGTEAEVKKRIMTTPPAKPRRSNGPIDNDVETIVLKALEKDRECRYQSAGELANDIQRYLAGEPIEAKRHSLWYLMRKTARRYKTLTITSGSFLLALIVFAIVVLGLWRQAEYERGRTKEALALAEKESRLAREAETVALTERERALRAEHIAQEEALRAESQENFLVAILNGLSPEKVEGRDIAYLRLILDQAAKQAEITLADHPADLARIHDLIGSIFANLSLYPNALPHLEAALQLRRNALGNQSKEVSESLINLGLVYKRLGKVNEADSHYRESIEIARKQWSNDDPEIALRLNYLGLLQLDGFKDHEAAEANFREALRIYTAHYGESSGRTATIKNSLAMLLCKKGDYDQAVQFYREVLAVREAEDPRGTKVATDRNNLAKCLLSAGRLDEAESEAREALELRRQLYPVTNHPDGHVDLASSLEVLGEILMKMGDFAGAESAYREWVDMAEAIHGPDHKKTKTAHRKLEDCLKAQVSSDD